LTKTNRYVIMKKRLEATLKKIDFLETELDWQSELLSEQHGEFDEFYQRWCAENDVDVPPPPEPTIQKPELDRVDVDIPEEVVLGQEHFKITYKKLAMLTHPDKNDGDDTDFKTLNDGWLNGKWSKIIYLANKYDVAIHNVKEIDKLLREEAKKMEEIIQRNSNMFSWKFWECGDDEECKEKLMQHFFKTINIIKKGE